MTMNDLLKSFKIIENNPDDSYFIGERKDNFIFAAENALGVLFPEQYKLFLKNYGCGGAFGEEFYGISNDDFINSGIPDAIWLTIRQRKVDCIPSHFVFIYGFGDGSYAVLNCGQDSDRGSVVLWEPGVSTPLGPLEVLARDFGEFMLALLKNAAEGCDPTSF